MTPQQQRCHICGAGMSAQNPEVCKNFHVQMSRSRPAPAPKFTKNCMCDKYTNCTDCQAHDATIAAQAREKVLKKVCSQCPIKNEEIPLEDYSAESCEGCLIRKVVESLRTEAHK